MTTAANPKQTAQLTLTEFLSLDGVSQAPGGPTEDTTGDFRHGGWVIPLFDEQLGAKIGEAFAKATGFLLGRRTYDIFASHWPKVTDPSDFIAKQLNALPKFVASRSTRKFDWKNTTAIRDVVAEVTALKSSFSGEIQVHGSSDLAQTLIAHDLIDEYRLLIFPVILGSGRRLFNQKPMPSSLTLTSSTTTSKSVQFNVYRRAGALETGNVILKNDGTYTMEVATR
jgi:dihydrofolate reductase